MIACADMKNVYNHASGAIKGTDCALHKCVRVVPVPARTLKLGSPVSSLCCWTEADLEKHVRIEKVCIMLPSSVLPALFPTQGHLEPRLISVHLNFFIHQLV